MYNNICILDRNRRILFLSKANLIHRVFGNESVHSYQLTLNYSTWSEEYNRVVLLSFECSKLLLGIFCLPNKGKY